MFWFFLLFACLWLYFGQTCVREAMHGVGASVRFSCATLDILLVFSYARQRESERERAEREPLKQLDSHSSFLLVFLLFLYSGSSLMRLSNGCLPSASRLACQMCQNSSVRSLLRFPSQLYPCPVPVPHVCHTCHLCSMFNSSVARECPLDFFSRLKC